MTVWVLVVLVHFKLFGIWDVTPTSRVGEYRTLTECVAAGTSVGVDRDQRGTQPLDAFGSFCLREEEV